MKEPQFAFPHDGYFDEEKGKPIFASGGMTLRDYFAAKAMQSFLMTWHSDASYKDIAEGAYGIADAMLSERSKTNENE